MRSWVLQRDFKGVVEASEGFEYKPERKNATSFVEQKWGWTADRPGTPLVATNAAPECSI